MNPKNETTARTGNSTGAETKSDAEATASDDRWAKVARLAYEKWQARGCPEGDDGRDWFEAEQEVLAALEAAATNSRSVPLSKSSIRS